MKLTPSKLLQGLGRNVVILGFVSLFTDISSEMLYPVIPLFLTVVLNAPMSVIGLIEGLAESAAGLLWTHISPAAPFLYGAACAAAAAGLLFACFHVPAK